MLIVKGLITGAKILINKLKDRAVATLKISRIESSANILKLPDVWVIYRSPDHLPANIYLVWTMGLYV